MFLVKYFDDFSKQHLCVVNNYGELNFLKERFTLVDYEPIGDYILNPVA